jgi:hypothetical protein
MGGSWRVVYFSGGQQPDLFLRLCAHGGYQRKYSDAGGVSMILNPVVSGGGGVETVTVHIENGVRRADIDIYYSHNGQVSSQNIMEGGNAEIQLQSGNSVLIKNNGSSSLSVTGTGSFDYTAISAPGSVVSSFLLVGFYSDSTVTLS